VNDRPSESSNKDTPDSGLKLFPLTKAEAQSRKSPEAKAVAAKIDSQPRGCESGKRRTGAFALSI
jgi:hypothetical protein